MHASKLTLLISSCLDQAGLKLKDLDGVAVSAGPGSYTGLRIGVSCAKGICHALKIPLLGIDTLRALAMGPINEDRAIVGMLDARRMDVYAAIWKHGKCLMPKVPLTVTQEWLQSTTEQFGPLALSGDGAFKATPWTEELNIHIYGTPCTASNMIALATEAYTLKTFVDVAYFEPMYLKPPNITMPKDRSI